MPEIAEVKLTSEFIDSYNNIEFVKLEKSEVSKVKTDLSLLTFDRFAINSKSRGKELTIDFFDTAEIQSPMKLKVTLGMSGAWVYFNPNNPQYAKYLKHCHLRLIDTKGWILGLYDIRRFAKWSWSDFNSSRGPCPISQEQLFVDHIKNNWKSHNHFKNQKLSEILMNQKWFNGIGNYLRAEILYRLDINPFQPASQLTETQMDHLIQLTVSCCKTAYKLGGGQLKNWVNPNGEDPQSFSQWMKCYGKLDKTIDATGRTFWYNPKWNTFRS
jgi:endonuclease VIII-like 1